MRANKTIQYTFISKKRGLGLAISSLALLIFGCVEPFLPETVTFESALVIEATITNETKRQRVNLSRAFAFESEGPIPERNATVQVIDDAGNSETFIESLPGEYLSTNPFNARPNIGYRLMVTTTDGGIYSSDITQLSASTQIDNLYAERITNDDGVEGMAIFVDSFDPTRSSNNYRYDYEETYKIIAPSWRAIDLAENPEGGCDPIKVPRDPDEQTCFSTDLSNSIILTNTNGFSEDRVNRFLVRFISRENYIISHRYSILVRQYVQSNAAYTFFETLSSFSGSESLFSESQPGFLSGNVFSEGNSDEKVLGYFDVASVTEQRIFFDYADFFPGEGLPPYSNPCIPSAPPLATMAGCVLIPLIVNDQIKFENDNDPAASGEGPYRVVPSECGDCTVLGGTMVPEFWVE